MGYDFGKLTAYLDSLKDRYGIPAVDVKITKDYKTIYRHMAGYSDTEGKVPVSERDLYRLYSATKVVTMTAILQLMDQGKLDLWDDVRKFLPEFTNLRVADNFPLERPDAAWPTEDSPCHLAHHSIRIIDLMSMTAGLSYDTEAAPIRQLRRESENKASTREIVAAMAKMPLLYEPGDRWRYSLAHDVLGAVVESASGMSFSHYLRSHIFDPLEIEDFYFSLDKDREKRLSTLYEADPQGNLFLPTRQKTEAFILSENYESGGAGLIASVDAYSTFLDALSNGGVGWNGRRILSENAIRLFSTNYVTGQQLADFGRLERAGYGYGLGVRVLKDEGFSLSPLGEFGWDGAAGAYTLSDPINHISIFYAQHILEFMTAYSDIHPKVRDLTYEAILKLSH